MNVTTWHNDNWRTGQNTNETAFSTGSSPLSKTTFGLLCKISLSGITATPYSDQVYAQPLVVANTGGGMTVYVVTQGDYLYAFNVPANLTTQQQCNTIISTATAVNLLSSFSGEYPVDCCYVGGTNCGTLKPTVGILGTPVIDTVTNTLYLVAESQVGPASNYNPGVCGNRTNPPSNWIHRLHALSLAAGTTYLTEKFNGPVQIQGSSGAQTFASHEIIQRPGLLGLPAGTVPADATVYAAFSMMDGYTSAPPSGWVFGYKASDLSVVPKVFATAQGQNAQGGGVWQGGAGLAAGKDENGSNYLFLSTADGDFAASNSNYGDSFLKLQPDLSAVSGSFTPTDQFWRHCNDMDYGSGGTVLLPDSTLSSPNSYLAIKADKENYFWVLDRGTPGGFNAGTCYQGPTCSSAVQCANQTSLTQAFQFATQGEARSSPAFWYGHDSNSSGSLYFAPTFGKLNKFEVSANCPPGQGGPVCTTPITSQGPNLGYLATPSVSSSPYDPNSQTYPNGIVWAVAGDNSPQGGNPAILYAFDASSSNLSELYDTNQCKQGGIQVDQPGPATKIPAVPTVANGYVVIGTQTDVDIYGNLTRTCQ
jgi:hypothetical protein